MLKARQEASPLHRSTYTRLSSPALLQEFDKRKREAAVKAISEESKKRDKAAKERGEIYAERRRV
jgi:hypothetical protein